MYRLIVNLTKCLQNFSYLPYARINKDRNITRKILKIFRLYSYNYNIQMLNNTTKINLLLRCREKLSRLSGFAPNFSTSSIVRTNRAEKSKKLKCALIPGNVYHFIIVCIYTFSFNYYKQVMELVLSLYMPYKTL